MLIQAFEQNENNFRLKNILFRGRSCFYWKRKIFKDVEPYEPGLGEIGFHYLIIFSPHLFLAIESDGINRIFQHLSERDAEKENIYSVEGKPFFAISRASFKKLALNLDTDENIINRLRNNNNVRILQLENRFEVLDLEKNTRVIENMVLYYQSEMLRQQGVILEDLGHYYIEGMPPIGSGTRIGSGVVIKGDSVIGENAEIFPHCYIENSHIDDNTVLLPGCVVRDSHLEKNVQIGPYAHLRAGAVAKTGSKMGNFVEMKKSTLGEGSKAMHLTYIGDAEIGTKVNIGAGTITCNYDGINKNKTVIEDGVFIGSGTELVAPVTIRKNAYVGAGSTITEEVPEESLGVARQKQRNIPGWVARKKRIKA